MMAIINRVPELVAAKFGGAENINYSEIHLDTRLNYATVRSWVKGEVTRVDYPALEAWCKYLKVQPGDILKYEPD
jgi:DNA-binding Xre family transcriptional regulator